MIYREYKADTYNIYTIKTDKFKTCHMEIVFRNNIKKEDVTKRSLISELLVENSKKFPTRKELVIENVVLSNDIKATIRCLNELGISVIVNNNIAYIKPENKELKDELIFDCGESGSTLRFFIPIALLTGKKVKFIGSEKLLSRGLSVYEDLCLKQNINYMKDSTSISFEGILKNGEFNIPGNISSQFITGLLLALPLLNGDSIINITTNYESKNYC
jgi:3-phosphoshikimate 1-carboxyvinyltransferase